MKIKLLFVTLLISTISFGQTVFSENIGTGSGTQTIATTTFQNSSPITFSGSGDTRTTSPSSGYTGASASKNVFITNTLATDFTISGIDTSAYTSLILTFGELKSGGVGTLNLLVVEVSPDGFTYTPLTYTRTDGAVWALISPTGSIPSTANLRIRFRNPATTQQFRIDDIKLTGTLSSSYSGVSTGAGAEPTTLSSLITTQGGSSLNFDFAVKDDANTVSFDDTLPTLITQIVIPQGTGNDVADWTQLISGAELTDGTNSMTGTINAANITFSSINTTLLGNVANDATKTYILKVWLKTALGGSLPATIDGLNLAFKIDRTNFTTASSATSTQFETGAGTVVESGSANNAIDVVATKLVFVQAPTNVNQSATMSPSVTVSAVDANGNRDLGYTTNVSLTSSGTMTGTPIVVAASSGLATYSSIAHTVSGTGFTLAATSGSITATGNSTTFDVIAPSATIAVTSYAHNSTYAFGSYAIGVTSPTQVFTISNTGSAPMTISGITVTNTMGTAFSISGVVPTTIGVGSSDTFTVLFSTSVGGTFAGYVVIASNSSNQANYTINLSGTITTNSASNIIRSTGFTEPVNIAYGSYQTASISGSGAGTNNIKIAEFTIQDGGGSSDTDTASTILNSITFTVTNSANIRRLAIYDNSGTSFVGTEQNGASSVIFSGLTLTAADNGSKTFSVYASFNASVTDNQNIGLSVTSATANAAGTTFAVANAGGAASIATGNSNKIVVTADRLAFVQQPSDTSISASMSPAVTVSANDALGNRDLDVSSGSIAITSSGTLSSAVSGTPTNGLASFSSISHSAIGSGLVLTATYTGTPALTLATSNTFAISSYPANTWRTASGTSGSLWSSTAANSTVTWERLIGTNWTLQALPIQPPTSGSANTVIIRHDVTLQGTNTHKDIVIANGGILNTSTVTATFGSMLIENGGTLNRQGGAIFDVSGTLEVLDGGTVTFKQTNGNSRTNGIWAGTEKFHKNSNFEIVYSDNTTLTILEAATDVFAYTDGTSTACFGNVIINCGTGSMQLIPTNFGVPGTPKQLTHQDLIFRANSDTKAIAVGAYNAIIGRDLIFESGYNTTASLLSTASTSTLTVKGSIIHSAPRTVTLSSNAAANFTLNVDGDITINPATTGTLNINNATGGVVNVNLKGDLTVGTAGLLIANSTTIANNLINFSGPGNGLTASTTQTIDIASTGATENQYINFDVKATAYTQLANRNLELGTNGKVTVEDGGVLDFGFSGTTPLLVVKSGAQIGSSFSSLLGSTLKITSVDGISTGGSIGNVQLPTISYNPTATFHYIGKDNQVTGDGIGNTGTAKAVIVELDTNSLQLSPSQSFGITSTANTNINSGLGGILDIRKGKFIESTTAYISGSTGGLSMADGTLYQIPSLSVSSTDTLPRLDGLSNVYNLLGTSTIELNGADGASAFDQYLRGGRVYRNLTFSTSGTKTISVGISSITGTITVANSAILDVEDKGMGGTGTNLTMTGTSEYKTAGINVKPDAGGTYALGTGTKVTFTSGSTALPITTLESIRLAPDYYNIDIVGNNVGTNTLASPIKIKAGGTFTVKSTGIFKHSNTAGFHGSSVTAIDNTNAPTITLDADSTVDYAGADQSVTLFSPYYRNLRVSGTGTKTLKVATGTKIQEDLNVAASKLLVNVNEDITVKEAVIIGATGAEFEIKNNGQLIQIDETDANSGTSFKIDRIASVNRNDYVYWSPPTSSFSISNILNNGSRFIWDTGHINANGTQGSWLAASTEVGSPTMTRGKGYAIAVPNSSPTRPSAPTSLTSTFAGKPNNGQFTFPIYRGNYSGPDYDADPTVLNVLTTKYDDNWNLVGNPYPSAISAETFLTVNASSLGSTDPAISGTIWVWKHGLSPTSTTNPFYSNFVSNYYSTDYIKYNKLGATDTNFSGYIASGQGFMINMKEGTGSLFSTGSTTNLNVYSNTITFNNSMRSVAVTNAPQNNTDFYKSNAAIQGQVEEKHRIWLDIINDTTKQADTSLLGYTTNATLGEDNLYDAIFVPRGEVNIYSVINSNPFIIQGRPLPFDTNDLVPMGVNIVSEGSHTIAIRKVDGMFVNEVNIYLEDKLLNIIHDLKQAPYVFTSEKGIFNNRFIIRYQNTELGTPDFANLNSSVVVSTNNGELNIKSYIENIQNVTVYDILGRQLFEAKNVDSNNFATSNISMSQQALIVKIKLKNEVIITRKIIL